MAKIQCAASLSALMFNKLKNKWGVSWIRLILILCTFAIGGSLCGYLGRKVMLLLPIDKGVLWWVLYIIIITLLWPLCVLVVSIVTGQFAFFKNYLNKMAIRMRLKK